MLDRRTQRDTRDPKSTKDDTRGNRVLLLDGGLDDGLLRKGGLESKGIFSVEGPRSLSWSRSVMDEQSSISK